MFYLTLHMFCQIKKNKANFYFYFIEKLEKITLFAILSDQY